MTTLTETSVESVEHLDFRPSCICDAAATCGHPKGSECGAEAAVVLAVHAVHQCASGETDADGNQVGPACAACLDRITAEVCVWMDQIRAAAQRVGVQPFCKTCGAPIVHVSDIIRGVRPIK